MLMVHCHEALQGEGHMHPSFHRNRQNHGPPSALYVDDFSWHEYQFYATGRAAFLCIRTNSNMTRLIRMRGVSFVYNVSFSLSWSPIFVQFFPPWHTEQTFGELTDVVVMRDKQTGRGRGFGFVTFADSANVDKVKNYMYVYISLCTWM